MSERYAFIELEKANHHVTTLCRVLEVSRSGYYDWLEREPSQRALDDEKLLVCLRQIHSECRGRYGQRRYVRALRRQGFEAGRGRVRRLMRLARLTATRRRKFKATTDSCHAHPVADNVLERRFDAQRPNQVWTGDITYIWTREGWLYLAVLIDLYSRRVIGWAMGSRITQELTLRALHMALGLRRPDLGLIHHTDRGSQYAATAYCNALKEAGVTMSMSRKGDCWDNATSESFFASLKTELVYERTYLTRDEAVGDILIYLSWYNAHRLHSTLEYVSPMEFERQTSTGRQVA